MPEQNLGFTPHEPVDAEKFFTEFVRKVNGEIVSERFSRPPKFFNADFYFPDGDVIAELKCFKTDFISSSKYQEKILQLNLKWIRENKVDMSMIWGNKPYPLGFGEEYWKLFKPPIQRILEKANKQIKNTKKELGLTNSQGIVFLLNDGLYGMKPEITMAIAARILTSLYTSIDGFIYLTLNKYIDIPGNDYANLVWLTAYSERAKDDLVTFVNDLGRKWFKYLEQELGEFQSGIEIDSITDALGGRFIE